MKTTEIFMKTVVSVKYFLIYRIIKHIQINQMNKINQNSDNQVSQMNQMNQINRNSDNQINKMNQINRNSLTK